MSKKNNSLWFHGPQWLFAPNSQWPKNDLKSTSNINIEEKSHVNLIVIPIEESEFLLHFSEYYHLLRITALFLRFFHRSLHRETLKYSTKYITVQEIRRAKIWWTRCTQSLHFSKEIEDIKKRRQKISHRKNEFKDLNPQLNEQKFLIVDGRLRFSNLPKMGKFPAILPAKSHFSK